MEISPPRTSLSAFKHKEMYPTGKHAGFESDNVTGGNLIHCFSVKIPNLITVNIGIVAGQRTQNHS